MSKIQKKMQENNDWRKKQIMERKYKLLTEDTIIVDGRTLYRIEAVRDFGDVKKGDKGGYIEKEENLSHKGDCWIYELARLYGNAEIYDDASVCGDECIRKVVRIVINLPISVKVLPECGVERIVGVPLT